MATDLSTTTDDRLDAFDRRLDAVDSELTALEASLRAAVARLISRAAVVCPECGPAGSAYWCYGTPERDVWSCRCGHDWTITVETARVPS